MVGRRTFLATAAAGVTSSLAGCGLLDRDREVISQYTYELNVEPAEPVTDAVLYVPRPVQNGAAALSGLVEDATAQLPGEWSFQPVDTDRGPMLEIQAPGLNPGDGPYYAMASLDAETEIDTRDALANEPVLGPRSNESQVECDFPHPDKWADRLRCYSYESELHGEYEGGVSTLVSCGLWGENSWWSGGWNGNEYLDRISGTVTGEGWVVASAGFREGMGNY